MASNNGRDGGLTSHPAIAKSFREARLAYRFRDAKVTSASDEVGPSQRGKIDVERRDADGAQLHDAGEHDEGPESTDRPGMPSAAADPPVTIQEYSNEARAFHARYAALSRDHDNKLHRQCREGCLDLLTEPRLPLGTRVQTLQMLSTILFSQAAAEDALNEAQEILERLDASKFQVALLKEDNLKMQRDLYDWRLKRGLVGKDVEEWMVKQVEEKGSKAFEQDEEAPVPGYWELDQDIQSGLNEELEEELEHVGYQVPGYAKEGRPSTPQRELEEKDKAGGLPSPSGSESG